MKKVSNKKRMYITDLWFKSQLKNSKPNLSIGYTEQGESYYFTIGTYSFNSITGVSHVEPLENMAKLSYKEVENLINK